MLNRRSLKIIIESLSMVLAVLFGIFLGNILNRRGYLDGHITNWNVVIVGTCIVVVYAIVSAIIRIRKLEK